LQLTELIQDPKNANRGRKRGSEAVEQSLRDLGSGRSILVDRNGVVIAGNKTAAGAAAAGLDPDVIVVESDGSKLIVVQRTDLDLETDPKAKALAVADNRTAELGLEWDAEVLAGLSTDLDLKPYFTPDELTTIIVPELGAAHSDAVPEGNYKSQYGIIVTCVDEAEQQKVYERLTADGLKCKVVVT
jgi:uncharacterized membrane-anchored protein